MWRHYRATDAKTAPWECVPESQLDEIEDAYHITMLAVDVPNTEGASFENARYWGDLVIDIDCGSGDDKTPEAILAATQRAIASTRLVAEYLALRSHPTHFQIFASGKKGFHIHVPAKLMHSKKAPIRHLNKIYHAIAKQIEVETGAEGIDFSLYAGGKGHMVRTPNKLRADGGYKVQVTYEELNTMTPERYHELVALPRPLRNLPNIVTNLRMMALVDEARVEVERQLSEKPKSAGSIPDELLEGFGRDDHPECIKLLGDGRRHRDTVPYHSRAHQLAIYLRAADVSDEEKDKLVSALAEAGHSSKHSSVEARKRHVLLDVLPYVKGKGIQFSCGAMHTVVEIKEACRTCPVNIKAQEYITANTGVQCDEFGMYAITEDGARRQLTNFSIEIEDVIVPQDHRGKMFDTWTGAIFNVLQGQEVKMTREFTRDCLTDAKSFTEAFDELRNGKISVTNNDVRDIRNFLLAQIIEREGMRTTDAAGIRKITSENTDTGSVYEEMLWVEEGWSWKADGTSSKAKLTDSVENIVHLARMEPQLSISPEQDQTLLNLLSCTEPEIVSVLLGWVGASQLKEHVFDRVREFPLLNLYGPAGSGKTSLARIFSALGAADYCRYAPHNITTDTPFAIKKAAWTSTTVPRVFDECNKAKMAFTKWNSVREVLKSCYQQSTMATGVLKDRKSTQAGVIGATTVVKKASSPVIFLSTSRPDEQEIRERSIGLWVKKSAHFEPKYRENFLAINNDPNAWDRLFALSRMVVRAALRTNCDRAYEDYCQQLELIPAGTQQRTQKSLAYILLGLSFMQKTFTDNQASVEVQEKFEQLSQAVRAWAQEHVSLEHTLLHDEIDNYFDKLNHAIARIDHTGVSPVRAGVHYVRVGNILYIDGPAMFGEYRSICRFLGVAAEFTSHNQIIDAMRGHSYYLGHEKYPNGLGLLLNWTKIDLTPLEEKGHDFSRFVQSV